MKKSIICYLQRTTGIKKFKVVIIDHYNNIKKTIHFGANGWSDYTIHKDKKRMYRYILRHKSNENWTIDGLYTAGFWSKWILWNLPSLEASIRNTEKRFNLKIFIV